MGRKRKNFVALWLNDIEFKKLKNKVSKTNYNQSDYTRTCILDKKITVIPGIGDSVIEIFTYLGNF